MRDEHHIPHSLYGTANSPAAIVQKIGIVLRYAEVV